MKEMAKCSVGGEVDLDFALRPGLALNVPGSERAGTPVGRKPSFTREQFVKVCSMLGQQTAGDPAGAEAALAAWGL
jgi:hypothetical protein